MPKLALILVVTIVMMTSLGHASAVPASPSASLIFEPNQGQTAPSVRYLSRSQEGFLFFTEAGVTVSVPRTGSFRLIFESAAPGADLVPGNPLTSHSNYLPTPGTSVAAIPNFGSLTYREIYPGIDIRFHGRGLHLEHEFVLAPGADPADILLRLDGIDRITVDPSGNLALRLGKETLHESAPRAWQELGDKLLPVAAAWKVLDGNRLTFELGPYDRRNAVTIDPVLAYSTHFGGQTASDITLGTTFPADTTIEAAVLDSRRNIYVAGTTSAIDFPTTAGAFNRIPNDFSTFHDDTTTQSGFVSKFDPTGRILIYSTFLHANIPHIAVNAAGEVYTVAGGNEHFNGPTFGLDFGILIDKLSADGSRLLYSLTFANTPAGAPVQCQTASGNTFPAGIAAVSSGQIWVAGTTFNPCMPTTAGAYRTTMPSNDSAGFVVKLDSTKTGTASIIFSTYLGGSAFNSIDALTIDSSGNAYVAGRTNSANFPHGSSFGTMTAADGGYTGFVTKLNASGSALVFSTLLHGVSVLGKNGFNPPAQRIVLDASRNVYVAGATRSTGFPTTLNAFKRTLSGAVDAFVTKLSASGNALVFSTLLGGNNNDAITGLAVNSSGMPFVSGFTDSTTFPTTANAFRRTYPAGARFTGFVTALRANGQSLYYSTLLGGSTETTAFALFLDPAWNAFVVGNTFDSNYPVTSNAFQPALAGRSDGFLAKVVIAADLRATLGANLTSVVRNTLVTFTARVTNLGPDGSDTVVLTDVIRSGFKFAGISNSTASSCSVPAIGSTTGSVICRKTRLEKNQSFSVNILLRAIAASGTNLVNKVTTSARTQDLASSNNSASVTVHIK